MTQNLIGCLSAPGGVTVETNRDGLQAIAGQIEAELQQSEVYRQAVASLQSLPDEVGKQAHMFLRAVSRTAIRLALKRFVRKNRHLSESEPSHFSGDRAKPTVPSQVNTTAGSITAADASDHQVLGVAASGAGCQDVSSLETTSATLSSAAGLTGGPLRAQSSNSRKSKPELFKLRKRSKPELSRQKIIQQREDLLRQLGQTIQEVRESKAVSLRQLHTTTLVPLHHLEALEMGRVDRLPEDVYLRGFIRRIGNALGLDGNHLAASLPKPETQDILPSWYHPTTSKSPSLHLDSMHLYLGYAALMAGGFVWLSQQAPPKDSFQLDLNIPNESSIQPSPTSQISSPPPQTNSSTLASSPTHSHPAAKSGSIAKPPVATSSRPTAKISSPPKTNPTATANAAPIVQSGSKASPASPSASTAKGNPIHPMGTSKSTTSQKATSVKAKPLAGSGIAPPETLNQSNLSR